MIILKVIGVSLLFMDTRTLVEDETLGICCTLLEIYLTILGDFNDHLSPYEKRGGLDRAPWLIRGFQDIVHDCGLIDPPLIRY